MHPALELGHCECLAHGLVLAVACLRILGIAFGVRLRSLPLTWMRRQPDCFSEPLVGKVVVGLRLGLRMFRDGVAAVDAGRDCPVDSGLETVGVVGSML